MAGLGAKKFAANSLLSSTDVNGYLAEQVIMKFANATARDAAFGGSGEPTLAEGMFCYLDDTNVLQSYTGTAWVSVVSSSNPPAMQLIDSRTVAAATFVEIQSCFSSTFDNYIVECTWYGSVGTALNMQYMTATNTRDIAANYYRYGYYWVAGSFTNFNAAAQTSEFISNHGLVSSVFSDATIKIYNPNIATQRTNGDFRWFDAASGLVGQHHGISINGTNYTGLYIFPTTGNITGNFRVYGYRNS